MGSGCAFLQIRLRSFAATPSASAPRHPPAPRAAPSPRRSCGEFPMVILRKRHILTSTALVIIIATPFISMATDTNKLAAAPAVGTHPASVLAAAPMTDVPATARAPSAPETAANSAGAAELLTPINETEQGGSLAAIDAVDRAVAEKIRDLLGSKTDRFFASAN